MFVMILLPSWAWWPPHLNLWVRRRFGPDPDGCFGVDIVSGYGKLFCAGSCVYIGLCSDAMFLSLMRALYVSRMRESGWSWPVLVCLWAASCRTATTVAFVPTALVGWGVGLAYGGLDLMMSSTCLLCVECLGLGLFIIIIVSGSLGWEETRLLFNRFIFCFWVLWIFGNCWYGI
jgi:hypothetical protein